MCASSTPRRNAASITYYGPSDNYAHRANPAALPLKLRNLTAWVSSGSVEHDITFEFSKISGWGTSTKVTGRDLWEHKDVSFTGAWTSKVPSHGTVAVRIKKA
eukprot:gene19159-927_t